MKVMALDVGDVRIGVAMSDADGRMAFPHSTINRRSEADDLRYVLKLAAENDVKEIVVGMPLHLSGHAGTQAREVKRFVRALAALTPIRIGTLDERYSSVEAQRIIRGSGEKPSRDKGRVDAVAASVLLQAHLDRAKLRREG